MAERHNSREGEHPRSTRNPYTPIPTHVGVDVSAYLESNLPPMDGELSQIQVARSEARGCIDELESSTDQLERTLQQYRERQQELQSLVLNYDRALSPLRQLSTEIISEIFLFACGTVVTLDVKKGPWVIAQVSRRWRGIALAQPKLWSNISIRARPQDNLVPFPFSSISILHTILCRSGFAKLDITFEARNAYSTMVRRMMPLAELLTTASLRWRAIDFDIHNHLVSHFNRARGNVPNLEKITIRSYGTPAARGIEHNLFEDAPRLKTVHFNNLEETNDIVNVPLVQLTRYTALFVPPPYILSALNGTQCLTELKLTMDDPQFPVLAGGSGNLICLNHLRHLDLNRSSFVLDHLLLPRLDSIQCTGHSETLHGPLLRLLQRSSCSLTKVTLTIRGSIGDAPALRLFEHLSSVVELNLKLLSQGFSPPQPPSHHREFLQRLTYRLDHADHILPRLETLILDLRASGFASFESQPLVDAIASRTVVPSSGSSPHMTRLRTLQLFHGPWTSTAINLETIGTLPTIIDAYLC